MERETSQKVYKSQSVEAMQKLLKNPIDPKFVKVRVGATNEDKTKGIALFYFDAREVEKILDSVLGMDGWGSNMVPITSEKNGFEGMLCTLTVRMPDGSIVSKTDAGEASKTSPIKGAASDALKRAAVQFGVGRYLYYIPNQWHKLTEFKTFEDEPKLPNWALPQKDLENWEDIAIMEYDPTKDVDIEALSDDQFVDEEAKQILKQSQSKRNEIIKALKAKKNVG